MPEFCFKNTTYLPKEHFADFQNRGQSKECLYFSTKLHNRYQSIDASLLFPKNQSERKCLEWKSKVFEIQQKACYAILVPKGSSQFFAIATQFHLEFFKKPSLRI